MMKVALLWKNNTEQIGTKKVSNFDIICVTIFNILGGLFNMIKLEMFSEKT